MYFYFYFFFQAEDGIRDLTVTGVQTCALPIFERFAADLLPVVDTLGLALESAGAADAATLAQGQEATLRLLLKAFERAGLAPIDPAAQPFDPAQHDAMAMQPSADHPPHTVLQVVQKGWILNGRLLRPARVIVSAEPALPEPPPGG